MTTIRRKNRGISKPQVAITIDDPSANHSPLHDLEIATRKHAIADESTNTHLHPFPHSRSLSQTVGQSERNAVLLARPAARSLPTSSDASGANVLEHSGPISIRQSGVNGSSDLPRRPRKATEHSLSLKIKTSFLHSVDTSPFCTPQPFALSTPPVFPVATQSVTEKTPEADTGESTSPNADSLEEQRSLECGNAGAYLANSDAAQEDSSSVFEDSNEFLSTEAELIELNMSHSSSANGAESSADKKSNLKRFVPISERPRRRERVASVEGDIPEEDDEDAEVFEENEIRVDLPIRPLTKPNDIRKMQQPSLHLNARIDSGNVPDADVELSTGSQLVSPVFSSRSSSVFANGSYGGSYAKADRRHSLEITRTCADDNDEERTRQLTQCDSAAARQRTLTPSVSRPSELLQMPELPRMGRRRSETVPPAYAHQMPAAVAGGFGIALVYRSSPTFRQMWARNPETLSYSLPPTPHHFSTEGQLDYGFFSNSLNAASSVPDGRTSATQLGFGQFSSEHDFVSPPARKPIFARMRLTSDTIDDSSSSSSNFRRSRHLSFNLKHTCPGNSSIPPQVKQHRRGSVCIPLENNQLEL